MQGYFVMIYHGENPQVMVTLLVGLPPVMRCRHLTISPGLNRFRPVLCQFNYYSRGQTNTTILISHDREILRANQLQIRIQQGEIHLKTYLRSFSHEYFGRPNYWAKFFKNFRAFEWIWENRSPPLVIWMSSNNDYS